MDINDACHLLDIDIYQIHNITKDMLKKKFHKSALKHHPDKNINRLEATIKFQQINEAYRYLLSNIDFINANDINDINDDNSYNDNIFSTNMQYINLLNRFISSIVKGDYKDIIITIVKEIINNYGNISNKLFDELNKDTCFEIYNFLNKYKDILHINNEIIEFIKELLEKKFSKDFICILNPSIDDLFENNIYKLILNNQKYLIPLWHNELYFDNSNDNGSDIIVFCIPELPENVRLDENNNLLVEVVLTKEKFCELLDMINFTIDLGQHSFEIPVNNLFIRKRQIYRFNKKGISIINENDMYDTSKKSDIIIILNVE
jgi:hypothetical protein